MDPEEKKQVQSIIDRYKGHFLPDGGEIVGSINSSSSEFAMNIIAHIVREYKSGVSERKTTRETPGRSWMTVMGSVEQVLLEKRHFSFCLLSAVGYWCAVVVCKLSVFPVYLYISLAIHLLDSKVPPPPEAQYPYPNQYPYPYPYQYPNPPVNLEQYFGRKRKDVAAHLGVSDSEFKRMCREQGIPRWRDRMGSSGSVRKPPDPHERNTSPTCKTTSSHGQTEMENQMVGHLHEPNEHLSDFFDGLVFGNTESPVPGILESSTVHDAFAGNYTDMYLTFSSVLGESEEPRGQQTDQSTLSAPCLEGHGSRSSCGIVVPTCSDPASTQPTPIISHPMPTMPPLTQSQDTSSVTVKATYEDNTIKIQLPLTSGIIELKKEVAERFKFELDSFNLKYEDEDGDWIWISCDKDLRSYLQGFSSLVNLVIRLLVVKVAKRTNLCESCRGSL